MAINYLPEDEETDGLALTPPPRRRLPGEEERGAFDVPVGQVGPDWLAAITEPSGTMPVSGGPVVGLSDILPDIPTSKEELAEQIALQAAGAALPGIGKMAGKAAKAAIGTKAGQAAVGKAVSALGKRAPAFLKGLQPEAVLEQAAKDIDRPPKLPYGEFVKQQPKEVAELFGDPMEATMAIPGRPMLPRPPIGKRPSPRVVEAMAKPEIHEKMLQNVEAGKQAMPAPWYRTGPLYRHYQEKYGDHAAKIYEHLMGMIGASTTKNTVPSNIKAGSYYNYLVRHGKKIPDKPAKGYGNFAQGQHVDKARVIEQYGKFDPLQYPKSSSFTENLLGNEQPMTLDTHEWRQLGMAAKDPRFLEYSVGEKGGPKFRPSREFKEGKLSMEEAIGKPTYWQAAPEKSEYGLYEQLVEPTVKRTGVTPASFQGHKWIGGKGETGVSSPDEPFLRTVASKIYYTALRMGEDPIKVLDYYVKGGPLLGVTGAAAGLSALPDEEESDQDGLQY